MDEKLNRTFLRDLLGLIDTEHQPHSTSVTNFAIFLNIATIIFNSFVIFVICSHKKLLKQSTYLQVMNSCVANFLVGVVVIPFSIYSELNIWRLSQSTCQFWILMDVYLPFVTVLIFIMINMEKFIMLTKCKHVCSRSKSFVTFELVLPWCLAMFIIFPVWIEGSISTPGNLGYCIVHLTTEAALVSHILTFFLPAWICLVLTVIILIKRLKSDSGNERLRQHNVRDSAQIIPQRQRLLSLKSLFFSNYIFIVLWFPHQFVSLLLIFCESCTPPYNMLVGISWMGASTSALCPMLWFTDCQIRKGAIDLLCTAKLCQKPSSISSTDSNDFELLESFDPSTTVSNV